MGVTDPAAYVHVEAGKSHHVELGPKGRPVIGQLMEPQGAREKIIWTDTYHHASGSMRIEPYPVMQQPANWYALPAGQKAALWEKWSASEEGRIHNENMFPIIVDTRPDGTFRVPDVAAGKYRLTINNYHGRNAGELVAALSTVVQVQPVAPGQAVQPQDLGRLTVMVKERLQIGDSAPEFAVNRLDGKGKIQSSDYKGKVVVLQFWWSELPVEAMDLKFLRQVAALAEREKNKLAVIGIGLGSDPGRMAKMAQEGGMNWPQGGTQQASKVTNDYHVSSYGVFLIGPDGKVLARQLSEREIMPAVEKALREMR